MTRLGPMLLLAALAGAVAAAPGALAQGTAMPDPDARPPLMAPHDLAGRLAYGRLLLVDVREQIEYDVSHLAGAMRMPPETAPEVAARTIAQHARGRDIVLYCAASARSQQLGDAIYHELMHVRAGSLHVLAGGIIAWANAGGPLVDGRGRPTRHVHPADPDTARLLDDPTRIRFAPQSLGPAPWPGRLTM